MIIEYLRRLAEYISYARNSPSTSDERYARRGPIYQARRDRRDGTWTDTNSLVNPLTLTTILMTGNTDSKQRARSNRKHIRPDPDTATTGQQPKRRRSHSGRNRRDR